MSTGVCTEVLNHSIYKPETKITLYVKWKLNKNM